METSNVQPMIEPDAEQMRRHVAHLFEGFLDGCHDGRIELAWTDGRDGRLRHAAIFGTDELDQLVARAVAENRRPKQNVYIGQALRKPGIPPFGRCKDEDFFALTAFYVDIDDDVTATATINYRHRGCPPTAVVVTGREPHVRAQMLWRIDRPERDAQASRLQNLALAEALGGDTSVVNPSRVMRLGGSIAWPVKDGRVIERTEFLTFDDGRPKTYLPEQIAKAFPPAQASLASAAAPPENTDRTEAPLADPAADRFVRAIRRGLSRPRSGGRSLARQPRSPHRPLDRARLVGCRNPHRRRGLDAAGLHGRPNAARSRIDDCRRPAQVGHRESRARARGSAAHRSSGMDRRPLCRRGAADRLAVQGHDPARHPRADRRHGRARQELHRPRSRLAGCRRRRRA